MNWEIEYLPQEGVVSIKTAGTLADVHQNQRMIADGLAEAAKHGATKFLIDDRDLTLKMGVVDIYNLPETYNNLKVNRKYKVAIVLAVSTKNKRDFRFYETRAINQGYNHRLFTDPQAALDWLTGPDAPPSSETAELVVA